MNREIAYRLLADGLEIRLKVTGASMRPFMKGGETVRVRRVPSQNLHIGDLVLYEDSSGSLVLHRIIGRRPVTPGTLHFETKGDGLRAPDDPVEDRQIMGKVIAVERVGSDGAIESERLDTRRRQVTGRLVVLSGVAEALFHAAAARVTGLIRSRFF